MYKTGIIILAAGSSTRLGKPKQLLVFQGKTLIERIILEAKKAELNPIVVITGAHSEAVSKVLENLMIDVEYNDQWQQGMGSGIVKGILKISKSDTDSVIISVCDQPYVSANLLNRLIKRKIETNKGIVSSAYSGIIGTPVLFGKEYFEKLLLLKGHEGAKSLLKLYISDTADIPFDEGKFDIDTVEDYNNLLLRNI